MGSGTTAVEAIYQAKRYIGIDLNPQYLDIAAKRIESELDQTTINLEVSE
jgi:DNA modification methylase